MPCRLSRLVLLLWLEPYFLACQHCVTVNVAIIYVTVFCCNKRYLRMLGRMSPGGGRKVKPSDQDVVIGKPLFVSLPGFAALILQGKGKCKISMITSYLVDY